MISWKRVQSGAEWGLFYGLISWLLAFGFSNQLYKKEVWFIILTRMLSGVVLGLMRLAVPWWIKGILVGLVINIPLAFAQVQWPEFGWIKGFTVTLAGGMIVGALIEMSLRHKYDKEQAADTQEYAHAHTYSASLWAWAIGLLSCMHST